MRSARFGFREQPEKKEEHRGSRPHMDDLIREAASDPAFREAAAAGFEPVTEEQAEALREKAAGGRV